jgi:hypothetical protein
MERSYPKKIISWIFIIILFFIIFIPIFFFYKYYTYLNYEALIVDDMLEVYYKSSDMPIKNKELYIDGKKYNYSIVKISDNEVLINNIKYTLIYLKLDNMLDITNIDNNCVKVSFKYEPTTLYQEFKKRILKGGK